MRSKTRMWVIAAALAACGVWAALSVRAYLNRGLVKFDGLPNALLFRSDNDFDFIDPLNDPTWCPATQAAHMRPDDPVVGLYLDQIAWALPWWVLKNHHVANVTLDGRPVLVNFCERCSSAAAFKRELQDQQHTFELAGMYLGTILVADQQTRTFWSPFTGEAIHGPLKGEQLERLPAFQCTWSEWIEQHPDSMVIVADQVAREGHASHTRPGSVNPRGRRPIDRTRSDTTDDRLADHELVLGVAIEGSSKAYALSALSQGGPVVHDMVGSHEIVILHEPDTWLTIAFARELDGEILNFEVNEDGAVIDSTTQSRWSVFGEAVAGPLAGHRLTYIPSGIEEWYAWAAYHPDTQVFDRGQMVRDRRGD